MTQSSITGMKTTITALVGLSSVLSLGLRHVLIAKEYS